MIIYDYNDNFNSNSISTLIIFYKIMIIYIPRVANHYHNLSYSISTLEMIRCRCPSLQSEVMLRQRLKYALTYREAGGRRDYDG